MKSQTNILQTRAVRDVRRSMGRHSEENSRLGLGCPVRASFIGNEQVGTYPLASLMSGRSSRGGGGRGGRTRVALYVSLLWVAGGGDHTTTRPASFWAKLIGLPDPETTGARTVRSTWAELDRRGFITSASGNYSGDLPQIRPLHDDGTKARYSIPRGHGGDYYFRVPENFWLLHVLGDELSGPGLAMYLIALRAAQLSRDNTPLVFPAPLFKERYGLSESTRKSGLRNLDELGVLDVEPAVVDDQGHGGHRLRPRNTYTIPSAYQSPASAPSSTRTQLATDRQRVSTQSTNIRA